MSEQQPPTPEEQAALADQMRAPRPEPDYDAKSAFEQRYNELNSQLTAERAARENAERRASAAEADKLASQPQNVRSGRVFPISYVIQDAHVSPDGDEDTIELVVKHINESKKDVPGFQNISVGDFLAMNQEVLDNEARARGFTTGARYAFRLDNGDVVSGYHIFAGTVVTVGQTSPSSSKSKRQS